MRRYYLGEFEEIVLLLVAVQHDQAYGFSITTSIEKDLKRSVTMSSVHTALYRLEEKGFVNSRIGDSTTKRGGRKKRLFTITTEGKVALNKAKEARSILWQRMPPGLMEGGLI